MAEKKSQVSLDEEEVKTVVKKKRGGQTLSIEKHNTATNEEMKRYIGSVVKWGFRERVKSDEECAERLEEFFNHAAETGELPTVEKMCLALGVERMAVWRWEQGINCSAERSRMIKQAKQILASIDADLVLHRKIPETSYIFRGKNYYGMRDQTEVVVQPNNPLGDQKTPEQLEEYLNVVDAE